MLNTSWLLWWFYKRFERSFWRHPFIAEDLLVNKWYNANFLHNCSDEEKLNYILNSLWVKTLSKFSFYKTIILTAILINIKLLQPCNIYYTESESFTYHKSSALWVHSEELPWHDTSAAALAERLLVYLFKHVLGRMVLQNHNSARVTSDHNIVYYMVRDPIRMNKSVYMNYAKQQFEPSY